MNKAVRRMAHTLFELCTLVFELLIFTAPRKNVIITTIKVDTAMVSATSNNGFSGDFPTKRENIYDKP